MAAEANSTSRRAFVTGFSATIPLVAAPALASGPSSVERAALAFHAVLATERGEGIVNAFNALMAEPADTLSDLVVKARAEKAFTVLHEGGSMSHYAAHAIHRDVCRLGGLA